MLFDDLPPGEYCWAVDMVSKGMFVRLAWGEEHMIPTREEELDWAAAQAAEGPREHRWVGSETGTIARTFTHSHAHLVGSRSRVLELSLSERETGCRRGGTAGHVKGQLGTRTSPDGAGSAG